MRGRSYTPRVPTTRPRHVVTETDDLARVLDLAAERWPGVSRAQLLVKLAMDGHAAAAAEREARRRRRLDALQRTSGALTGAFGPDYLDRLRSDWEP